VIGFSYFGGGGYYGHPWNRGYRGYRGGHRAMGAGGHMHAQAGQHEHR
jgi:hypothetical protein